MNNVIDTVSWLAPDGSCHFQWTDQVKLTGGKLRIIDQRELPGRLVYLCIDTVKDACDAVRTLAVRGAPAIGCAAGLALAASGWHIQTDSTGEFLSQLRKQADCLNSSRPTAVNLSWALNRCLKHLEERKTLPVAELKKELLKEALAILREDIELCDRIGEYGSTLLADGMGILTHCNAGALAAGGNGTALAPIYAAMRKGMKLKVYSDETRPLLQGSRLTAWELMRAGADVTTICDNMAAQVMREGRIQAVIVGADRIASNGDAANKIGTYGVAVLAHWHRIPFYVAAPYSTFDLSLKSGEDIPIEQRDSTEITGMPCGATAPEGVKTYNPAFDVTPHSLIRAFITDRGIVHPPFAENFALFTEKTKNLNQ